MCESPAQEGTSCAGSGIGLKVVGQSLSYSLLCLLFPSLFLLSTPNSQVQELRSLGFGPEEGSLQALFQHGGDVTRALTELQRQRLEPFHQRLWDSGPEPTPSWDSSDKQVLGGGEETHGGGEGRLKDRSLGSDGHFFPLHLNHIAEPGQTTFGSLHTPQLGPGRAGAGAAAGDTQEL